MPKPSVRLGLIALLLGTLSGVHFVSAGSSILVGLPARADMLNLEGGVVPGREGLTLMVDQFRDVTGGQVELGLANLALMLLALVGLGLIWQRGNASRRWRSRGGAIVLTLVGVASLLVLARLAYVTLVELPALAPALSEFGDAVLVRDPGLPIWLTLQATSAALFLLAGGREWTRRATPFGPPEPDRPAQPIG